MNYPPDFWHKVQPGGWAGLFTGLVIGFVLIYLRQKYAPWSYMKRRSMHGPLGDRIMLGVCMIVGMLVGSLVGVAVRGF